MGNGSSYTLGSVPAAFDDFGGGALTGVSSATPDASAVPAEVADDGAAITVAVDFPTDVAAPEADAFVNQIFLPLVTR